jgi:hypothetical protein
MIDAAKHPVSHEDRHISCQEAVDGPIQAIIDRACTQGWGTIETISAMEEVLKNLRTAYAEDPNLDDDPPADSGDGNDFGEFPSAEGLVKACVQGREKP